MDLKMEDLYLSIINNLCDGVYFVDTERKIIMWNKAAEEITGYRADEIVGTHCQDSMLNHIDGEGRPLCSIGCPLFATIIDGKQRKENVYVRHKKGYRIPVLVNIFPFEKDGEIVGAIEIFTQNSPSVYEDNLIEQLSGIAMHDSLTGLPNRHYLKSYLDYKLGEYKRFDRLIAVMFADIDNFGQFNNLYGHDIGDKVLINVGESIAHNIRKNDLVGRWGGEEFVGIYSISQTSDAPIIGEKFRRLISDTGVTYQEEELNISASVGITVVRPEDTAESLIERADLLMYQSKKEGKNRVKSD
ncbi:MAG: diguanylate cyclase [Lachnospiraceae bacterium]